MKARAIGCSIAGCLVGMFGCSSLDTSNDNSVGDESKSAEREDDTRSGPSSQISEPSPQPLCPADVSDVPFDSAGEPVAASLIDGPGFVGAEGPVWIAHVNALFFSDKQGEPWGSDASSRIWKYTPSDRMFIPHVAESGSNGLARWVDGRILAATHSNGGLTLFDSTVADSREEFLTRPDEPFGSPNDLAVRADGVVYFSDPTWQTPSERAHPGQRVYWVDTEKNVQAFKESFTQPNGVSLSPDEQFLYVNDQSGRVWRYTIAEDGSPTRDPRDEPFIQAAMWADGMVTDCAGNIYVASSLGVEVFDAQGQPIGQVTVDGGGATNVAFGGEDRKTLFITTNTQVYMVELNVPGLPY